MMASKQRSDQVEELEAISEALAALQTLTEVLELLGDFFFRNP